MNDLLIMIGSLVTLTTPVYFMLGVILKQLHQLRKETIQNSVDVARLWGTISQLNKEGIQ